MFKLILLTLLLGAVALATLVVLGVLLAGACVNAWADIFAGKKPGSTNYDGSPK